MNSSLSNKKKLHIFQSTFLPTLAYGLDAITLTDKYLARVDAYYIRFLRCIVNIKASYYSRVTNHSVWRIARSPRISLKSLKPSFWKMYSSRNLTSQCIMWNSARPIRIESLRQDAEEV